MNYIFKLSFKMFWYTLESQFMCFIFSTKPVTSHFQFCICYVVIYIRNVYLIFGPVLGTEL